jgi:hypothetical protein
MTRLSTLSNAASTDEPNRTIALWRTLAWAWLVVVTALGTAGFVGVYRNPALVRIPEFARLYQPLGIPEDALITVLLSVPLGFAVASAAFILLRKRDDRGALMLAASLVAMYFFVSGSALGLEAAWLRDASVSTAMVVISVFLVTFPSGSYRPRWSVLCPLIVLAVAVARPGLAAETRALLSRQDRSIAGEMMLAAAMWPLVLGIAAAAQTTRYRRFSTESERTQTRWVLLGACGILGPPVLVIALLAMDWTGPGWIGGLVATSAAGSYGFPIAVTIAVFRHHLYDIDRVISRTITFAILAAVIGVVYTLPVVLLPTIVGRSSDLIVAASTLTAAAAFSPARRRIQRVVDRRFDRSHYQADEEIAALAQRLSGQVDLGAITRDLGQAIERTLAPETMGLWLRGRLPVQATGHTGKGRT